MIKKAEISSVLIRKLISAEYKLIQLTIELHLAKHIGNGKRRDWRSCWNPICVEARRVLGEDIPNNLVEEHIKQRIKRRNAKRASRLKNGIRQGLLGSES
jgi:hypothetical protein